MTQNIVNGLVFGGNVGIADGANLDAFSRLRTSNPNGLLDSQFTYDLQPLIFEQLVTGTGATLTHDTTNRMALMTFSSSPSGSYSYLQSYEWFRYQAGRGQFPIITVNMNSGTSSAIKFAEYGDGNNAYGFQLNGTIPQFYISSLTNNGNQVISQSSWNLDKLDGTGTSGLTFSSNKEQILIIDFQALYVGRVRMGFDIDGHIYYCHEFLHSNTVTHPYIQNASLPVRVGMRSTATSSTTMWMNCATVLSEGGAEDVGGLNFTALGAGTAGNGTDVHILSIRPKQLFNSISNRSKIVIEGIEIIVTGVNPVIWKLVLGQAITGTTAFTDVNTTYSAMQFNTAGNISGTAAIIIDQGFVSSSGVSKGSESKIISNKYPITLDKNGATRLLGTLSVVAQGVGGTSAMQVILKWREIR